MKTKCILLVLSITLVFFIISCSSDNIIEDNQFTRPSEDTELIPVRFTLDGIDININPFPTKSTENELPNKIKEIIYFVHLNRKGTETDSIYKFRVINKSELTSTILDTLPKGNYRFSFVAMSDTTVAYSKGVRNRILDECTTPTAYALNNELTSLPPIWEKMPNIEIFANKLDLTIGNINPSIDVTLFRKTSQLQLTIKDANLIPDSIESLGLYITPYKYTLGHFRYYPHQDEFRGMMSRTANVLLGDLLSNKTAIKNLDKEPLIINTYPLIGGPIADQLVLQLRGFNKKGKIAFSKSISVRLVSNKITKMSGYLYDERNLGFNIVINEDWNGEVISEFE